MLTETDYLELLLANPKPEECFFYHDRPILYPLTHSGNQYMISLLDEDSEKKTDSFLLVRYSKATYALLQDEVISPREFFIHPDNTVHQAVIEYTDNGPTLLLGERYEDNLTIPDEYLPMAEARWNRT